jgi:hypothetical protein
MDVLTIKSDYTLKENDTIVVCDSGVAIAVTLKSAVGNQDMFYIKNIGAADVTITATLPDLIDGATTLVLAQYESATLLDFKTNVWIKL